MRETNKEKPATPDKRKSRLNVVTYTYKDGISCTVVTPAPDVPKESPTTLETPRIT